MKIVSWFKDSWKYVILYVLLIFAVCYLFTQKVDYHIDEVITYVLSNDKALRPEEGFVYSPADVPFMEVMTSHGLDIKNVWETQADDVHPPFYYLLVHIICTIFTGKFSMWYAGAVNIIFILMTLFIYRRIADLLVDDKAVSYIMSLMFVLSAGVLSINTYLRMYVMAMFFVTAVAFLIIRRIDHYSRRDYILIGVTATCGALTHYYFLVYLFFISVIAVIFMLYGKRIKECLFYILTMCCAGACSALIFPAMFSQLFKNGKGAEYAGNMAESDIIKQVKEYYKIMNRDLFAGIFGLIIVTVILLFVIRSYNTHTEVDGEEFKPLDKKRLFRVAMLLIPAAGYFVVVSVSANYNVDRYIAPIYGITLAGVLATVYIVLSGTVVSRKNARVLFSILAAFIICRGLSECEWNHLYEDEADRIEWAADNASDYSAIVFYEKWYLILPQYKEISMCNNSSYYMAASYEEFVDAISSNDMIAEGKDVVLFFALSSVSADDCVDWFIENYPSYEMIHDTEREAYYFTHVE